MCQCVKMNYINYKLLSKTEKLKKKCKNNKYARMIQKQKKIGKNKVIYFYVI